VTAPILVPHDLSDAADHALRTAMELPYERAPRIVLHVLPRIDLQYPGVVWSEQDDEPRRQHALQELTRHTAAVAPDAVGQVAIGDPATRIVERARELGARLIVMPSHGRRGLDRFVLGSVSEHVTRFAPCPVLVLPAGTAPQRTAAKERHLATGRTRAEQMDELGTEICAQVDAHRGAFLTALRIGLPPGEDSEWWERALEKRLADAGVEFVDLVFTPAPRPLILDARFEQRWA
jgi:nucleotide-binding universal stress UspA family protein